MRKRSFRFVCFIVAFVILLSLSALNVSAAENLKNVRIIDYRDYLEYRDVSGNNYVNYLSFPKDLNTWIVFNSNNSDSVFEQTARDVFVFEPSRVAPYDVFYQILYKPLDNTFLTLNDIPSGSIFNFDYKFFVTSNYDYYAIVNGVAMIKYFDANGVSLDTQIVNFGSDYIGDPVGHVGSLSSHIEYTGSLAVTKPAGARYMEIYFYLRPVLDSNDNYNKLKLTLQFETTTSLSLSIPQSYVDEETGRLSNEILGEITDQNEDLINGTGSQMQQVGSDVSQMGSDGDRLAAVTDSMKTEKPDADSIDVSISSLIPDSDILIFTAPLMTIWENNTLLSYITIVLTLVLVSWVMFGKK